MQICEEQFVRNGMLEEVRSKMVGMDTPALRRAFANNRAAAEKRLDAGETESLTIKETHKIGRNDPCPCGSQVKFKKCCGSRLAANDSRIAD